jgi:thiamine pyrophosphokinase
MKRCFIFAAGTFFGLRETPAAGDLVIAADAGYLVCQKLGIRPDLVLGDFDSMPVPEYDGSIVRLPVEKDDTDTIAAVRTALENDCKEIFIYGGTGGKRLDHTLANLQTLLFLRRKGARGYLYDDDFLWTVIENESLTICRSVEWGLFSAFCLGDRAEGIDETGFQYTLENGTLTPDFPMGVSNHIVAEKATVSVRSGALAVGWELPSLA